MIDQLLQSPYWKYTSASLEDDVIHSDSWASYLEKGLKALLCTELVLGSSDVPLLCIRETDMLETGNRVILTQIMDLEEPPVVFISLMLLPRKCKCAAVETGCMAIKRALTAMSPFLFGRYFTLITNNTPIHWMATLPKTNASMGARWFLALQLYPLATQNCAGAVHGNSCLLSLWTETSVLLRSGLGAKDTVLLLCDVAYACGRAEYRIGEECCPMCGPGSRVYKHCTEFTSTSCIPCIDGTFTEELNGLAKCLPCAVCDQVCGPLDQHFCIEWDWKGSCTRAERHTVCKPGQFIIQKGTASSDTICGECPDKTFSDGLSTYCKPHKKLD
ncbi:uncharacterized protein LOC118780275 [Megalops cyprinoides]|uniref:uncharacterized protein LOC118780275 n=1 Tax=Megalops cyprinoides TaxID=118141 RepID=UPI001863BD52|nr:uncharacterized protein LOC118780275 [Megalops cyprinoides]